MILCNVKNAMKKYQIKVYFVHSAEQNYFKSRKIINLKFAGTDKELYINSPMVKWKAAIVLGYKDGTKAVRRTKTCATKKEALASIPTLKLNPITDKPNMKFEDVYTEWSEIHFKRVSKSSIEGYKYTYEKYCQSLKYLKFSELRTIHLQNIIDACPYGLRVKKQLKILFGAMYKYAMQNDIVNKNYAQYVVLPKGDKVKKDVFSPDEINKIWDAYNNGEDILKYFLIMIYTGFRLGELLALRYDDVDIENKFIIGGLKTDAGKDRRVPICEKILPIIEKCVINENQKIVTITRKQFYENYKLALKNAGVRILNPHCCRHTAATALTLAKVEPAIIKEIIGHSSFAFTVDHYVHISDDEKQKAMNKLT